MRLLLLIADCKASKPRHCDEVPHSLVESLKFPPSGTAKLRTALVVVVALWPNRYRSLFHVPWMHRSSSSELVVLKDDGVRKRAPATASYRKSADLFSWMLMQSAGSDVVCAEVATTCSQVRLRFQQRAGSRDLVVLPRSFATKTGSGVR